MKLHVTWFGWARSFSVYCQLMADSRLTASPLINKSAGAKINLTLDPIDVADDYDTPQAARREFVCGAAVSWAPAKLNSRMPARIAGADWIRFAASSPKRIASF